MVKKNKLKMVKKKKPLKLQTTGHGSIELRGYGRRRLENALRNQVWVDHKPSVKPIKVLIEAEITDVQGSYDGIGQDFCLRVKKLKKVA